MGKVTNYNGNFHWNEIVTLYGWKKGSTKITQLHDYCVGTLETYKTIPVGDVSKTRVMRGGALTANGMKI